jgi:acyl-CoA synthetase (NDP forming)
LSKPARNIAPLLTELESKQILKAYGIPTVESVTATTAEDAIACAEDIGYPVVAKLVSKTITHKTDVGGVRLKSASAEGVREAYEAIAEAVTEKAGPEHFQGVTVQPMIDRDRGYELIIGSSVDAQFGPVILFGTWGTTGGGVSRSGDRSASPQYHPGPPLDGANPDLQSPERGAGPPGHRYPRIGNAAGAL